MALVRIKRSVQKVIARFASWLDGQREAAKVHDLVDRGLLVIGRASHGTPHVWIYRGSEGKVVIGSYCSIAPGVQVVLGGIHPVHWVSTYPFRVMWSLPGAYEDGMPSTKGDVDIGCDVWIGTDAMILSGVTIGHGAVIAARAVVTQDVRPYSIVAGAPAKEIGTRFDARQVEELLRIQWWDWSDDKILEAVPLLSSADISEFLERYGE